MPQRKRSRRQPVCRTRRQQGAKCWSFSVGGVAEPGQLTGLLCWLNILRQRRCSHHPKKKKDKIFDSAYSTWRYPQYVWTDLSQTRLYMLPTIFYYKQLINNKDIFYSTVMKFSTNTCNKTQCFFIRKYLLDLSNDFVYNIIKIWIFIRDISYPLMYQSTQMSKFL